MNIHNFFILNCFCAIQINGINDRMMISCDHYFPRKTILYEIGIRIRKEYYLMKHLTLIIVTFVLFLVGCGGDIESNMSKQVKDFEFTTQDNNTLSLQDLNGEWWIADFVFTNCVTVCPPMTFNMSKLQKKIKEEKLDVQLVSFTVDPEFDTPEVLKDYAKSYEVDLSNWTFLTGYDFDTIEELSVKSFGSVVAPPPTGSDQVIHGTSFFLVSPEGKAVKSYSGVDAEEVNVMISDLKKVLN
jgi:protein SCO1/2